MSRALPRTVPVGLRSLPVNYGADLPWNTGRSGRKDAKVRITKEMLSVQQEKVLLGSRRKAKKVASRVMDFRQTVGMSRHSILRTMMSNVSETFAFADTNGDEKLDYSEFAALLHSSFGQHVIAGIGMTPSDEQVRQWFETFDINTDGTISLAEFFSFTLQAAMHGHSHNGLGEGIIEGQLEAWDQCGGGVLDRYEFKRLAKRLAYAEGAITISEATDAFLDIIDPSGKGEVVFGHLQTALREILEPPSKGTDGHRTVLPPDFDDLVTASVVRQFVQMLNRKCDKEDHESLIQSHAFSNDQAPTVT